MISVVKDAPQAAMIPEQALSLKRFWIESEISCHQPEHQRHIILLRFSVISLLKLLQLFSKDVSCLDLPFNSVSRCNFI